MTRPIQRLATLRAVGLCAVLTLTVSLGCGRPLGHVQDTPQLPTHPWSMQGANPARSGQSGYLGPRSGTRAVFYQLPASDFSDDLVIAVVAAADDGTIYAMNPSSPGRLYAIRTSGTLQWESNLDEATLVMGLALDPLGHVLVAGSQYTFGGPYQSEFAVSMLFAFSREDPSTGTVVWEWGPSATAPWLPKAGPVLTTPDGRVFFEASIDNVGTGLFALDADGRHEWTFPDSVGDPSAVALGPDGTLYVAAAEANVSPVAPDVVALYALTPGGTPRWSLSTEDLCAAQLRLAVAPDGRLLVRGCGALYSFTRDGELEWRLELGHHDLLGVARDGTAYACRVVQTPGEPYATFSVVALRPSGQVAWEHPVIELPQPGVAIDDEGVVYASTTDRLYAWWPDGVELFVVDDLAQPCPVEDPICHASGWSQTVSSPVIGADGRIYRGSTEGMVYAVGP